MDVEPSGVRFERQELDSIGYYRKLVVYFGQNAIKFSLPTP